MANATQTAPGKPAAAPTGKPASAPPATAPVNPPATAPAAPATGIKHWLAGATKAQITRRAARNIPQDAVITGIVANPKRGASYARFAKYRDGMTVAQYCEAVGKVIALQDLAWDANRGFITLSAMPAPHPQEIGKPLPPLKGAAPAKVA